MLFTVLCLCIILLHEPWHTHGHSLSIQLLEVMCNVTAAQYIVEICRYLFNTPQCEQEVQHKVRLIFGNGFRSEVWEDCIQRFINQKETPT